MNSIAQNEVTQLYLQHCSKREMLIHACDKYAHEQDKSRSKSNYIYIKDVENINSLIEINNGKKKKNLLIMILLTFNEPCDQEEISICTRKRKNCISCTNARRVCKKRLTIYMIP